MRLFLPVAVIFLALSWFGSAAAADHEGCLALHDAAWTGDTSQLESMLRQGVGVDCRDTKGLTALMKAALMGSPAAVRLLLHNGAGVNVKDNSGSTAMSYVMIFGIFSGEDMGDFDDVFRLLKNAGAVE